MYKYRKELRIAIGLHNNWMHDKQILPISLESFEINSSQLQAPKTLKDYIKQFQEHNKKL